MQKVREAADYPILKVKMGSDDDREVLTAVRDTTNRPIRVDANEGWTPAEALARLEWLHSLGVELVEQPLPAAMIAETRELRRHSPLPFYADESVHRAADIPPLAGAFDGINIKLMKCGGIGEALRMIAVARAHGMKIMLGCMIESSIAITAAAHISPLVDTADLDGNLLLDHDPFVGCRVEGGKLDPARRPRPGRHAARLAQLPRESAGNEAAKRLPLRVVAEVPREEVEDLVQPLVDDQDRWCLAVLDQKVPGEPAGGDPLDLPGKRVLHAFLERLV